MTHRPKHRRTTLRRRIASVVTAVAAVAASGLVVTAGPAPAAPAPAEVARGVTVHGYADGTVTTTGVFPEQPYRFAHTTWCVWGSVETSLFPLATATSEWSTSSNAVVITSEFGPHINYMGCQNYARSQEIYVYYSNMPSEASCWIVYAEWDAAGHTTLANATINLRDGCRTPSSNPSTAAIFRAHVVSMAIGTASGLVQLASNVRVMGYGDDAYRNVPYANSYDGQQMTCRYVTSC